ncbi:MAG: box helicase [Thermoleophilia bacterium]|nr:box helicase [Thermoleophilia bacterium]
MGRNSRLTRPAEILGGDERVVHRVTEPARRRRSVSLDDGVSVATREALERAGITRLHAFQRRAANLLADGRHVVLSGGTGAGKSLCYQLPILEALATPRPGSGTVAARKQTALYLAPTKALAQDQARRMRELGARWAQPMLYDGDTPIAQRALIRRQANLLLTNPDMLSAGILPAHAEWATFLRGLAVVVVDESHVYRGVFGSHVAQVLRRLRRILASYGNEHVVFCLSSATIGNPEEHAQRLTGLDELEVVGDDGAPRSARDLVLWNPELDEETDERDSALGDAVKVYASLLEAGVPTIVFARSRKSCELVHRFTRDRLEARGLDDVAARIAPYRAGYTPEQRRATERALASGELLGVVATSALELGIDIGALQASVVVTFPGTITSLRQRWGRAGRGQVQGLGVLIAGEDALDQYFMRNPEELLDRAVEHAIVSVRNPRILQPHLLAAASEVPLGGEVDEALWPEVLAGCIEELCAHGQLRQAPAGYVFSGAGSPSGGISLRSTGGGDVVIIDAEDGQLLGTVEIGRAATSVHPGAVYLHRGEKYLVEQLDTRRLEAFVRKRTMPYYTMPKVDTQVDLQHVIASRALADSGLQIGFGRVTVTDQLVGYQRIDAQTHRPIDVVDEHLPPIAFETEAVFFAAPESVEEALDADTLLGALHAAEHGLIALLPLIATCDRWDIGGLSINIHETFGGGPGIFVYDGHPGGIGIVEAGYARFERWAAAARDAIAGCGCESGCPSCVQSPKCGNLNEPLDKAGAVRVLDALLGQE